MTKAMREAKAHTNWTHPNTEHEGAVLRFVEGVMTASDQNSFLPRFVRFQRRIAYYGALSSLSLLLLKIASPGVPDFYQGTELWDLSLVDPDNRRPVNFPERRRLLEQMVEGEKQGRPVRPSTLLSRWRDGRIKLFVTYKALAFRRTQARVFQEGDYAPLSASEPADTHLIAFARCHGKNWAVIAAPRLPVSLCTPEKPLLGESAWGESTIALPGNAPRRWRNAFTGEELEGSSGPAGQTLRLADVFRQFPLALLSAETAEET